LSRSGLTPLQLVFISIALFVGSALSKRAAPQPVALVVVGDVEYSTAGDGRVQYVVARELNTPKELWKVEIFRTPINPQLEEDVQWVFITELKLVRKALVIRDEKSRCYLLDLSSRAVSKRHCW